MAKYILNANDVWDTIFKNYKVVKCWLQLLSPKTSNPDIRSRNMYGHTDTHIHIHGIPG